MNEELTINNKIGWIIIRNLVTRISQTVQLLCYFYYLQNVRAPIHSLATHILGWHFDDTCHLIQYVHAKIYI